MLPIQLQLALLVLLGKPSGGFLPIGLFLAVHRLWLQEKVFSGEIRIVKVKIENNTSDMLTKHVVARGFTWLATR